jgi:molybdate transport system substrate-binding protein
MGTAVMRVAAATGALAMLSLAGTADVAGAAEIRVYCSGAPAAAAKAIAADFSAKTGHQITFIVGQPATIQRQLEAGDKADVVILPSRVIATLSKSGAFRAQSTVDVARVGIGVVVRAGAPQPDISSSAAIRQLLLDARSIVYPDPRTGGGSAGRAIEHMIDQMGIADAVKPKLMRLAAIGGGVALVAGGKADIGLFNASEILTVQGVTLVGPLPAELQSYIVFDAAIPARNAAPEPAIAFIKMLADPAERPAWQKAGLEPAGAQ